MVLVFSCAADLTRIYLSSVNLATDLLTVNVRLDIDPPRRYGVATRTL